MVIIMEPQVHAPGNMNLPPVAPEAYTVGQPAEQSPPVNPEMPAARTEITPAAPTSLPPAAQQPSNDPVLAANPVPLTTNDVSSTTNSAAPAIADDGDLIEKEWVVKAKQIVEQTRENPYRQSRAMTGLKADYLQKRYQKSVKLSE